MCGEIGCVALLLFGIGIFSISVVVGYVFVLATTGHWGPKGGRREWRAAYQQGGRDGRQDKAQLGSDLYPDE